ncbi:hypothetical protein VTH06DRAFT_5395 [Thermothelomyces fergusii]
MRADVLATLFLTRRFHVVYSPYTGNSTQPAATHYMNKHGPLMAFITLEMDFTKLAGSWRPEAARLDDLRGLDGVKRLVDTFVQNQLARRSNTPIRDLRLLVRRYHGFRPPRVATPPSIASVIRNRLGRFCRRIGAPETSTATGTPTTARREEYTPAAHVRHVLSALPSLGPVVSRLTLSGAPTEFVAELVAEWPLLAAGGLSSGGSELAGEGASLSLSLSSSSLLLRRVKRAVKRVWGGGEGRNRRKEKRRKESKRASDELRGNVAVRRLTRWKRRRRRRMGMEEIGSRGRGLGQDGTGARGRAEGYWKQTAGESEWVRDAGGEQGSSSGRRASFQRLAGGAASIGGSAKGFLRQFWA